MLIDDDDDDDKSCKAPVKSSPPTNQNFFTGPMPFLLRNQQRQSSV